MYVRMSLRMHVCMHARTHARTDTYALISTYKKKHAEISKINITYSEFTELAESRFLDCDSCGMTQGAFDPICCGFAGYVHNNKTT